MDPILAGKILAIPDPRERVEAIDSLRALLASKGEDVRVKVSRGPLRDLTIIDMLRDRRLIGASHVFDDLSSWRAWLAALKAIYGLPMDDWDLEAFRRHTGRREPREGGYPEAVIIAGVQCGKSQIAAAITVYEAIRSEQRDTCALLVAQSEKAVKDVLFLYSRRIIEDSEELSRFVIDRTAERILLDTDVSIAVRACRPAAVFGLRAVSVVLDELAFYMTSEGNRTDSEMMLAARGRVATTGGRIVVISSPYEYEGELWNLKKAHYGEERSATLVWEAKSTDMNPRLSDDYLERMRINDPDGYRRNVLGEFRAGTSAVYDPDQIQKCVRTRGALAIAPMEGGDYFAFVDPSGGKADAFTLGIAHMEEEKIIVDLVVAREPPCNPASVVAEFAELLKDYGVREVCGDRYGGEWPGEAFDRHGIGYKLADKNKSEMYLELVPKINRESIEIPNDPDLLRELRLLQRRRGSAGKDKVDHPAGGHDDRANVVAGLASMEVEYAGAVMPTAMVF